jgi:hypothetical protein
MKLTFFLRAPILFVDGQLVVCACQREIREGRYLQHHESEHEPCDQVNSEGIGEFLRSCGIRVDYTTAWDQDGGVAHPEATIGRERWKLNC